MKFRLALLTFFALFLLYPSFAANYCTIVTANNPCPAGTTFLYMGYNYTDSHVNFTGSTSDNFKECCNFINDTKIISATDSCDSYFYTGNVFDFYNSSDSHVAKNNTLAGNNFRLCGNNSMNRLECQYVPGSRTPPGNGFIPVIYLYQGLDSHVELANLSSYNPLITPDLAYSNTVFCRAVPKYPLMISLTAISKNVLRAVVRDQSINEVKFEYYGNTVTNPTSANKFGENDSTSIPTTGTQYTYDWDFRTPNTTYYVRSRVIDDGGTYSDYSNELSRSTFAAIPINVNVQQINDTALNVSWNPNVNPSNTIYTLYFGIFNDTPEIDSFACKTTKTWCIQTGLRRDSQYCYKVGAMNSESILTPNSTPNCGSTTFTATNGVGTVFDPTSQNVPSNGVVKTYLFIKNAGNVPDRYNVNFAFNPSEVGVTPSSTTINIPANTWDNIEVTVTANNFASQSIITANVQSTSNSSSFASAQFTLNLREIQALPGITNVGIILIVLLSSLIIFFRV